MVGRLVEDQEVGVGEHEAGDLEAALLAAAQAADRCCACLCSEKRSVRRVPIAACSVSGLEAAHEVHEGCRQRAATRAPGRSSRARRSRPILTVPASGGIEARDDAQKGGLAAAVGADDADALAVRDGRGRRA